MSGIVELQQTAYGTIRLEPLPQGYAGDATSYAIEPMHDSYGRRINYLRISLTDACNLRCVYCMPEHMKFRQRSELMSDEEILTLVRVGASLGVNKIRLTGGEPSIRPGVVDLVREIARTPGIRDLAMTTNGLLLDKLARPLAAAGLKRVNISIDTLDAERFHKLTRWGSVDDVWRGIRAAETVGMRPIKLNSVIVRGFNDGEDMVDLARLTLEHDWEVRFIEMMPFGEIGDFQQSNVVTFGEMRANIEACGRVRLTADGKLRLCLLRDDEVDLLTPLRNGASFEDMRVLMRDGAFHKPWGHSLAQGVFADNRAMNQIGG